MAIDVNSVRLDQLIKDLNSTITDLQTNPINTAKIPSNFSLMTDGITSQLGLDTLFNGKLDDIIDKLFDNIVSGNFESVLTSTDFLDTLLKKIGISDPDVKPGANAPFQGKLSQKIIGSINTTLSKPKFVQAKTGLKKVIILLKDLNDERKKIRDPITNKKFEDAIYAIKKTLIIVNKIYKQRKKFTDKVKAGLSVIVNEDQGVVT